VGDGLGAGEQDVAGDFMEVGGEGGHFETPWQELGGKDDKRTSAEVLRFSLSEL
jgi:hypothetical protein